MTPERAAEILRKLSECEGDVTKVQAAADVEDFVTATAAGAAAVLRVAALERVAEAAENYRWERGPHNTQWMRATELEDALAALEKLP